MKRNSIRTSSRSQGENLIEDFVESQSIAISQAEDDDGLFQLDFFDKRYLPFEGAGVISGWQLKMQKNFESISDVIITIGYTSRQ